MKFSSLVRSVPLIALFFIVISFSVTHTNKIEDDILKYTNDLRVSKGLPALQMQDEISLIAKQHSIAMARNKVPFGHDGFEKREAEVRKALPGISSVGENVASGPVDGRKVVDMWYGSKHHRENMLGDFKYIGIGTATDAKGDVYFTEIFAK